MKPTGVRLIAIACGLFGLALNAVTWRWRPGGVLISGLWLGSIIVITTALYWLLTRAAAHQLPATLAVSPHGFAANPSTRNRSSPLPPLLVLAGEVFNDARSTGDLVFGLAVMLAAGAVMVFTIPRPQVLLTADELVIRPVNGKKVYVDWDDLLPWEAPALNPRKKGSLTLLLRAAPTMKVPIGALDVDPYFLAFVIDHYIRNQEDRPEIGSEAELTRLKAAFADAAAASVI